MTFDRRSVDLPTLNSLTKYPSIPTYHALDRKNGGLTEEPTVFPGKVVGTEKVDGCGARIILLPDEEGSYILGSREELLYAQGDLIGDQALGIVEALRPVADDLKIYTSYDTVMVLFLELYGGTIGGQAKQYSTCKAVGWRLFDVAIIDEARERLAWPRDRIASWREHGGQPFADEFALKWFATQGGVPLVPRLFEIDGSELPGDVEGMYGFLGEQLPITQVALDDSAKGAPEGIVLRSRDRSVIAKARFQDYERTLRRRAGRP